MGRIDLVTRAKHAKTERTLLKAEVFSELYVSYCEMEVPTSIDLISLQFLPLKFYDYRKIDGVLEWEGLVEKEMGKGDEGGNTERHVKLRVIMRDRLET